MGEVPQAASHVWPRVTGLQSAFCKQRPGWPLRSARSSPSEPSACRVRELPRLEAGEQTDSGEMRPQARKPLEPIKYEIRTLEKPTAKRLW